jgi:hypothetical protein
VVPSSAAYQSTVEPEEQRRRDPDAGLDREPTEDPERDGHVDRPDQRRDELCVGGQAPDGHERHQHDRRQRREWQEGVAGRLAVRSGRQDHVLEEVVAAPVRAVVDGVADRGPPSRKASACHTKWL